MRKWVSWFLAPVAGMGLGSLRSNAADLGMAGGENRALPRLELCSPSNAPPQTESIWAGEVGDGYRRGAHELGLGVGIALGKSMFGGSESHDLALASLDCGWVVTSVLGQDHWYRGNVELLLESFGGEQFRPRQAWIAEGAALLRYDLATGTPLVPFLQMGGGAGGTDIEGPDLSSTFEFNLQAGAGVHYFFLRNTALTFQCKLLHISNARIRSPDLGMNVILFSAGVSWFF